MVKAILAEDIISRGPANLYQVALKTVIDNISDLVVEQCLIVKLPFLFTADTVFELQDTDLENLARESDEVADERDRSSQKLRILQDGLSRLQRHDKHHVIREAGPADNEDDDASVSPSSTKQSATPGDQSEPEETSDEEFVYGDAE